MSFFVLIIIWKKSNCVAWPLHSQNHPFSEPKCIHTITAMYFDLVFFCWSTTVSHKAFNSTAAKYLYGVYGPFCPFQIFSEVARYNKWLIEHYGNMGCQVFKRGIEMVFCYQNCSDLLWEKIVLVIEKNFWNSRLKAKNLQIFWDH